MPDEVMRRCEAVIDRTERRAGALVGVLADAGFRFDNPGECIEVLAYVMAWLVRAAIPESERESVLVESIAIGNELLEGAHVSSGRGAAVVIAGAAFLSTVGHSMRCCQGMDEILH